jgi:arsenate reductase (thioredoxin)
VTVATVLFVCKANRGRSVMSQALFERAAGGRHRAISAGSEAVAGGGPHPEVVEAMGELGIDVASQRPQALTTELAAQADAVITMGGGDACPVIPGKKQLRLDWDLPDPKDRPLAEVRATRDDIDRRVRELVAELDGATAA